MNQKHELGDVFRSFNKLGVNLKQTADFADEIAQANFNANYEALGENDKLGLSLLNMRKSLIQANEIEDSRKKEEDQRNWVTNGIAKFSELLRQQDKSIEEISYIFVSNLVEYMGAIQGGLFILDESDEDNPVFEMTGSVAYGREKSLQIKFGMGESLVGRCAFECLPIYLLDVPDNYVNITSGLGKANPRSILLVPAILNDKVYAVIELISFNTFEDYRIEFIEKLGETIATTISSLKVNEHTRRLLEDTKQQSEELAAQEEEMRQNLEELQATQEEITRIRAEDAEKSEKMLQEVEKHKSAYVNILDKVPLNISLKDANSRILIVNQKVLDDENKTRDELIGKNYFDTIIDQENAKRSYDKDQNIIKVGDSDTEVHTELVSGEECMLETKRMPFFIDYMEQTGILSVQSDVTEILALQNRIKELEEELAKK